MRPRALTRGRQNFLRAENFSQEINFSFRRFASALRELLGLCEGPPARSPCAIKSSCARRKAEQEQSIRLVESAHRTCQDVSCEFGPSMLLIATGLKA
jgi:hypothetical protein